MNETTDLKDERNDDSANRPVKRSSKEFVPWFSMLVIVACIIIYVGLILTNDYQSWKNLSRFGCLPPEAIWKGAYWGLITSAFVHFEFWHLAFNLYWLWVLGSCLEEAIGSVRYMLFFIGAAFVSSSFQFAVSEGGIGASGVGYALFGFMWFGRKRYPEFRSVMNKQTIRLFVGWFFLCLITTNLKIWNIGNAAHFGGAVFGVLAAGAFTYLSRKWLWRAGFISVFILAIIPLVWCPWSVTWLSVKAFGAHDSKNYDKALWYYSKIIAAEPDNSWAYRNRSLVYQALGDLSKSNEDYNKARELDPSIQNEEVWEQVD